MAVTESTPSTALIEPPIIIRPAQLTEYRAIGLLAARTYYNAPVTAWLSPRRAEYPQDYERGFIQRSLTRMLDPRNLTFVAVAASAPLQPICGYAQFQRKGNDSGAKEQIKKRGGWVLYVLGWIMWMWFSALNPFFGGDNSANAGNVSLFHEWVKRDEKLYWDGVKGRENRWYVQSCVVAKEWQGKGLGKMLMREVLKRAERENVIVGLEASEEGEHLVSSVLYGIVLPRNLVGCNVTLNIHALSIFLYHFGNRFYYQAISWETIWDSIFKLPQYSLFLLRNR